jgi:hypothetical protein
MSSNNNQQQQQPQNNNENNNNNTPLDVFLSIYSNVPELQKPAFRQASMKLLRDHPQAFVRVFSSIDAFKETQESLPQLEVRLAKLKAEQKGVED